MAVAITATVQDVYPPRTAVGVTGLTLGDGLVIYRQVAAVRTAVRGGAVDPATSTSYAAIDAEIPYGIPVSYVAVVNGADAATFGPNTYTLPGGKAVLSDAITGAAAEVVIMAAGGLSVTKDAQRFRIGGRTLTVSAPFGDREGSYELFLETIEAVENLTDLLRSATQGIVQLRAPLALTYERVDAYLAVDRFIEDRWSQDGSDPRRLVTIEFTETVAWPATLTSHEFTYGDVATFYTGLTYADAAGDYATYLDAVQGDYS